MANRYFKISTKTELLLSGPAHLIYDSENADHAAIDESNAFFSALPAGQQLVFDGGGLPTGTEAIPAPPAPTTEEQAVIDLQAAGVTPAAVVAARYLEGRGDTSLIDDIDDAVDDVVTSSGLTLAQVSELIA